MESSIWHTVGTLCHRYPRVVIPCWHLISRMNQTFWDLLGVHNCAWGDTQVNSDYNKMFWKRVAGRKGGLCMGAFEIFLYWVSLAPVMFMAWSESAQDGVLLACGAQLVGRRPGTEELLVRTHGRSQAQSPVKSMQEVADWHAALTLMCLCLKIN